MGKPKLISNNPTERRNLLAIQADEGEIMIYIYTAYLEAHLFLK